MGQGQPTKLTDKASSRPLPSTSTLEKLCGARYTYKVSEANDFIYAMDAMKALGFVLVKNVFSEGELKEIAYTTDAMVEACKEKSGGRPAFGNRGPDRQSASGFYENIEAQTAGGIIFRNTIMQCMLENILGENFVYGGTGVDVAFPGTVYQHLHSDDNGSYPYDNDQTDVRHRWWPPAMVLAGPLLNEWKNENGPMRIVPWTAMNASEYRKITRHGISYNDERAREFLTAFVEGERGDLLIRDPRALHAGCPNTTSDPRSMISIFAYSKEANATYPDLYVRKPVPEHQQSLPRFRSLREEVNEWNFDDQTRRYGEMRTLSGEAGTDDM